MERPRVAILVGLALALCATVAEVAKGDVLVMNDGRQFKGKVTEEQERYVIVLESGIRTAFPKSEVKEVLRAEDILVQLEAELEKARGALGNDATVEGLLQNARQRGASEFGKKVLKAAYDERVKAAAGRLEPLRALASWCRTKGLTVEAEMCGRKAIGTEFRQRFQAAAGDPDQMERLAEWCGQNGLQKEKEQCLSGGYAARKNAAKTPDALWAVADWCDTHGTAAWRDACRSEAISAAESNGTIALLERFLARLEAESTAGKTVPTCARAIYRLRSRAVTGDAAVLEELATWCGEHGLDQEKVDCLTTVYTRKTEEARDADAHWAVAKWCDGFKMIPWRDEREAEAIRLAIAAKDRQTLERFLGELEAGGRSEGSRGACSRGLYALRFDAAADNAAEIARLAVWARQAGLDSEAAEAEAKALKIAPDNSEVRTVLGFRREKSTGAWTKTARVPIPDGPAGEVACLKGHTGAVKAVAFCPDGTHLVSAGADGKVLIWDVATKQLAQTFSGHAGAVNCIAVSSDGRFAASGGEDTTVRVWDVRSGRAIHTLRGHTRPVISLGFSRDGRKLTSGSEDRTAKFWDVASGKEERTYDGHKSPVYAVAYLADGSEVATVSYGLRVSGGFLQGGRLLVQRLNRATGEAKVDVIDAGMPECASFSPDDRYLLLGMGYPQGAVLLFDLRTRRLVHNLPIVKAGPNPGGGSGTNWIAATAFSPDATMALAGGTGKRDLYVWNIKTGDRIARFVGHDDKLTSVTVSPDSRFAASASADGTVRSWRLPRPGAETKSALPALGPTTVAEEPPQRPTEPRKPQEKKAFPPTEKAWAVFLLNEEFVPPASRKDVGLRIALAVAFARHMRAGATVMFNPTPQGFLPIPLARVTDVLGPAPEIGMDDPPKTYKWGGLVLKRAGGTQQVETFGITKELAMTLPKDGDYFEEAQKALSALQAVPDAPRIP